jgi:hypothetical protein
MPPLPEDSEQREKHPGKEKERRNHVRQDADVCVGRVRHRIDDDEQEKTEQASGGDNDAGKA